MTKNSLCSCPQTCKLITSWVNSVKTAYFQSTHVTPASAPLRYAANKWEGLLFTNCPAFNETSVFMVLAYTWSQFCISHMPFCFPAAVPWQPDHAHVLVVAMLPHGNLTALLYLYPAFLSQNQDNHSQQTYCSSHQVCQHVGFQFPMYTSSTHGQCKEEHPWRQGQVQSMSWFLAFTEPLLFTHNTRVEMVACGRWFFRVDYIRVQGHNLGSTSEGKCAQKRKGFPSSFSEAVSLDMGFKHECTWETKPRSRSLALCAQSPELLRQLMKLGTS